MSARRALILLLVAATTCALPVVGCVEGSDEHEAGVIDMIVLAGNRFFSIDRFGTQSAITFKAFTADIEDADPPVYIDFCLLRGGGNFHAITSDFTITLVDPELGGEVNLFRTVIPGGEGLYESRLGYAGRRIYLLSDTEFYGKALSYVDFVDFSEDVVIERMEDMGPGYERPVSFDLTGGGHQAWVLFESGKLHAFNLYYEDEPEREVVDLGPGFSDVNIGLSGKVYVAGGPGLFRLSPGGALTAMGDVTDIAAFRLGDTSETGVYLANSSNQIKGVLIENGFSKDFSTMAEEVLAIESFSEPWVKNTKPIIEEPVTAASYPTGVVVPYFIFFDDPDGEKADITVTIETDPGQGAYFVESGNAVVTISEAVAGNGNNATFYSGDTAGTIDIAIEALSTDGQLSTRRDSIAIQ